MIITVNNMRLVERRGFCETVVRAYSIIKDGPCVPALSK
jgi:hypothetical protein